MAIDQTNVADENQQQQEVIQPAENEEQSSPGLETQIPTSTPSHEKNEDDKEYNFKQLREGKKQLEEEVRQLKDQMDSFSKAQASTQQEDEDTIKMEDDDLVEGRHVKKLMSRVEKMFYQKTLEEVPDRLKSRFSDFNEVVSKENVEKLKLAEPELFQSIINGTDLFSKGVSAYKTLKALGIYKPTENYMKQKNQVQENHKKPLSVQAIKGQGALHEANSFANGLTPELRKQLQKEMAEAAKAR